MTRNNPDPDLDRAVRQLDRLSRRAILKFSLAGAGAAAAGGLFTPLAARAIGTQGGRQPIVETTEGKVRGLAIDGIHIFKGIHYGASTAGANRFLAPGKPERWSGLRDAFEYGPNAPQVSRGGSIPITAGYAYSKTLEMNEDCLVLNVWTPGVDRARRPVMVWIHGGAFIAGSAADSYYDGAHFVEATDVVLVSLNYRLGPFGFLGHPSVGGNFGLLDQRAALEWVQRNIAKFGGDPANVTIFGESAGGISVCTHLVSPPSKGLFQRAIIESGPCSTGTGSTEKIAEAQGDALAKALGCVDAKTTVECASSFARAQ
jgi:para-nitrobenzyl esterase